MIVVWQWIKTLMGLGLVALVVVFGMVLSETKTELVTAKSAASHAHIVNQVNQAQIQALTQRNTQLDTILTQRREKQLHQEATLRETTTALRHALEKEACYQRPWPDDVIKRLQQSY